MKLLNGTAGAQVNDGGRVHGGAGWYDGCASAQDNPPAASAVPALSIAEISISACRCVELAPLPESVTLRAWPELVDGQGEATWH